MALFKNINWSEFLEDEGIINKLIKPVSTKKIIDLGSNLHKVSSMTSITSNNIYIFADPARGSEAVAMDFYKGGYVTGEEALGILQRHSETRVPTNYCLGTAELSIGDNIVGNFEATFSPNATIEMPRWAARTEWEGMECNFEQTATSPSINSTLQGTTPSTYGDFPEINIDITYGNNIINNCEIRVDTASELQLNSDWYREIIQRASLQLAEQIDNDIMRSLYGETTDGYTSENAKEAIINESKRLEHIKYIGSIERAKKKTRLLLLPGRVGQQVESRDLKSL